MMLAALKQQGVPLDGEQNSFQQNTLVSLNLLTQQDLIELKSKNGLQSSPS